MSYYDFFKFTREVLNVKINDYEMDDLESRLDRLGMAFIEFNEFNEFTREFGVEWGEPLLQNDLEDQLDKKLNLSYLDYNLADEDYFQGCSTILTSEKAALAKVSMIYRQSKRQSKNSSGAIKYVDSDFGPKNSSD